jgi:hypothetical protein
LIVERSSCEIFIWRSLAINQMKFLYEDLSAINQMRFLYENLSAINQMGFLYENFSAINQMRFLYEDFSTISIAHSYEIFIWESFDYQYCSLIWDFYMKISQLSIKWDFYMRILRLSILLIRLGMGRIETDPNGSIPCFDLKPTRTESQEPEPFNFDSGRFQPTSDPVETSKKDTKIVLKMRS